VRQRLYERCVHGEHRVEEVREADPVRLRDQPEKRAITIETPRPALSDHFQTRLIVAIKDLLGYPALWGTINESEGIGAMPLHAHDGCYTIREEAPESGIGFEIF